MTTYEAIWSANLLGSRVARALSALAAPRHARRSATLQDMLGPQSPWRLVKDEPDEVVLALHSNHVDVTWSITTVPLASRVTISRPSRAFRLAWPLIAPFAALLRAHVIQAIEREVSRNTPAGDHGFRAAAAKRS